ncbi:hypothetical protein RHSIM_Rhsim09G0019600 [Rhododendron simsii]|uniref:Uncharacterized protein n=1 Tax=Rhododendron simsii TaxID=118357 RepID=A0A834LCK9_RHOSS|nr:hypothetical protein RHSIM_Rhsim09G0019600 [Rhododendron simsii]
MLTAFIIAGLGLSFLAMGFSDSAGVMLSLMALTVVDAAVLLQMISSVFAFAVDRFGVMLLHLLGDGACCILMYSSSAKIVYFQGKVKQIVGSMIQDLKEGSSTRVTNFESDKSAALYVNIYKEVGLTGGHVIMIGASKSASMEALHAYPALPSNDAFRSSFLYGLTTEGQSTQAVCPCKKAIKGFVSHDVAMTRNLSRVTRWRKRKGDYSNGSGGGGNGSRRRGKVITARMTKDSVP